MFIENDFNLPFLNIIFVFHEESFSEAINYIYGIVMYGYNIVSNTLKMFCQEKHLQ